MLSEEITKISSLLQEISSTQEAIFNIEKTFDSIFGRIKRELLAIRESAQIIKNNLLEKVAELERSIDLDEVKLRNIKSAIEEATKEFNKVNESIDARKKYTEEELLEHARKIERLNKTIASLADERKNLQDFVISKRSEANELKKTIRKYVVQNKSPK